MHRIPQSAANLPPNNGISPGIHEGAEPAQFWALLGGKESEQEIPPSSNFSITTQSNVTHTPEEEKSELENVSFDISYATVQQRKREFEAKHSAFKTEKVYEIMKQLVFAT